MARPEMLRIRDFLHDQISENVSLEQLAAIAGLSPFHLCRVFRQTFGVPPHVYQTQVRILHAKKMLANGQSLSEIAQASGFYDQSHFGWHFKRLVGVTPASYRTIARTS
jgi:AraC-like DNA-binding protein